MFGGEEVCGQGELVSFSSLRLSLSNPWQVCLLEIGRGRALQLYSKCLWVVLASDRFLR